LRTTYNGDDAWKEWDVIDETGYTTLKVTTIYSGENAWKYWRIYNYGGNMNISTTFSGDDAWKSWSINDYLKNEKAGYKMAAIFACVFSGYKQSQSQIK
jgi:hypothetical protein